MFRFMIYHVTNEPEIVILRCAVDVCMLNIKVIIYLVSIFFIITPILV